MIASNYDKFPVNYDKFPVGICVVWITFVFAIVPRETFLPLCWPLCRSAGLFVALLASLSLCWPLCRSAGLLPLCWPLCRSAGLFAALLASLPLCWRAAGALVYRATAASLSFCLPVPGVLLLVVTLPPAADLCRLHLLCCLFSVAQL